ncbi:hypothetical protein ACIBG6_22975 [Streptomyces sp. NPDC050842]|uniref:hypothetical protein n=1 Tax=Streptomyces sp. NPDC050842 TaxID=3365636 RepID=UPI0037B47510
MIYRNFIAPSRDFTQLTNAIIRHPRLDSDAARILNWQLSLAPHAHQTLSETAERARIGACSFIKAKRQLKAEGYVHERRVQGEGGLWATQQLVSSEPLRAEEAAKIFGGMPFRAGTERVFPQLAPSAVVPAVGHPASPSTDGHPEKDPREDTSLLPPAPEPEMESESESEMEPVDEPVDEAVDDARDAQFDEARALVGALPLLSPALRYIPPGMRDELALLVGRWLAAGHTSADVHEHVLRGLPGAGTPVHRPGGLVRYLLRHVPPLRVTPPAGPPRLSPRLEGAQECAGRHTQPMLFRPVADETLCPECASWATDPVGSGSS